LNPNGTENVFQCHQFTLNSSLLTTLAVLRAQERDGIWFGRFLLSQRATFGEAGTSLASGSRESDGESDEFERRLAISGASRFKHCT
jgi:hypothetical protein